jgi:hypothetical protein
MGNVVLGRVRIPDVEIEKADGAHRHRLKDGVTPDLKLQVAPHPEISWMQNDRQTNPNLEPRLLITG